MQLKKIPFHNIHPISPLPLVLYLHLLCPSSLPKSDSSSPVQNSSSNTIGNFLTKILSHSDSSHLDCVPWESSSEARRRPDIVARFGRADQRAAPGRQPAGRPVSNLQGCKDQIRDWKLKSRDCCGPEIIIKEPKWDGLCPSDLVTDTVDWDMCLPAPPDFRNQLF